MVDLQERPVYPRNSYQTDVGPPIERRKGTYRMREIEAEAYLTPMQVDILEQFVWNELKGGVLPFLISHPRTGAPVTAKLKDNDGSPYTLSRNGARGGGGLKIVASMTLTVLGA